MLFAYGSGSLGDALDLAVMTHFVFCAECRSRIADVEAIGGVLLDELPPTRMEEDALAHVLALADRAPSETPFAGGRLLEAGGPAAQVADSAAARKPVFRLPAPLDACVGAIEISEDTDGESNDAAIRIEAIAHRRWRPMAPGIRHIALLPRLPGGGTARLLRVAPGTALAHHGHRGREATVVLSGGFSDELGHFGPGDFAETDDAVLHQPIVGSDKACVCLIATENRLRFTGRIARLLQPVIGL
jgi:putative transcriptional regulator